MEEALINQPVTKTQIKKLGKAIRAQQKEGVEISEHLLLQLQNYRTSFKKDVAEVFTILSEISKRSRKDRVVTFRIKRIESILSKIKRQKTMQLDTMGDIAGCRCIVQTDAAVIRIVQSLKKHLNIKGIKDYLKVPKDDGYSAYHLYVESPIDPDKQIEIQIRSQECHNWATLVEIIDIIYEKKIKEGQQEPELNEFLFLMSKKDNLNYLEKDRVIELERSFNIYLNLSNLFAKNYLPIRNAWFKLESKSDHKFFVISVDTNKTPNITSYNNYDEAEQVYFDIFSLYKESNVVLTHLDEVNFRKLCIAYSNYLLIKHSFLEDWQKILFEQIEFEYVNKNRKKANDIVLYFRATIEKESLLLKEEIKDLRNMFNSNKDYGPSVKKFDEWILELEHRTLNGEAVTAKLLSLSEKNAGSAFSQFWRGA